MRWVTASFLVLLSAGSFAAPGEMNPTEPPVRDPSLEGRLQVATSYRTRSGDTLATVAQFLWGHSTWWRKIQVGNPGLGVYGPESALPVGLKIAYRAPRVASSYTVERNDWLIRIVQWKYGETETWEEIFRKNAAT